MLVYQASLSWHNQLANAVLESLLYHKALLTWSHAATHNASCVLSLCIFLLAPRFPAWASDGCLHAVHSNTLPCSTGSCHNLAVIGKALRTYLNHEWQRKLEEEDVSSVPSGWAQKHPGQKRSFAAETMPGKSAQVPRQEDYCNCGLFVLAYMEFWTHAPPDQVELCERGAWKGTELMQLSQHTGVWCMCHCSSCKCLVQLPGQA